MGHFGAISHHNRFASGTQPALKETRMKKTLTALVAAAGVAAATAVSPTPADARCYGCGVGAGLVGGFVAGAIVGSAVASARPAYVVAPGPGYVVYSGELLLDAHAGLRCLRQHGWLARSPGRGLSVTSQEFAGATHASPPIRIDAVETGRGNASPLQTALSILGDLRCDPLGRPTSALAHQINPAGLWPAGSFSIGPIVSACRRARQR